MDRIKKIKKEEGERIGRELEKEAEDIVKSGDQRELYKFVNRVTGRKYRKRTKVDSLTKEDGSYTRNEKETNEVWEKYIKTLFCDKEAKQKVIWDENVWSIIRKASDDKKKQEEIVKEAQIKSNLQGTEEMRRKM